jgi:hypothetical protein
MSEEMHWPWGFGHTPLLQLLGFCARTEMPAEQIPRLQRMASRVDDFGSLIQAAEDHALGPLLHRHLQALAPNTLPDDVRRGLVGLHLRHKQVNARRGRALAEIFGALHQRGIHALSLKGGALAFDVYPEPGLRPMRDLDIFIAAEHGAQAMRTLQALGYTAAEHGVPDGHHHLPAMRRDVDGLEQVVELHVRLFSREDLRRAPVLDDSWPRRRSYELEGQRIDTLCDEDMLWFVYRHGFTMPFSSEPMRLIWVADVHALVESRLHSLDWSRVRRELPRLWRVLPLFHCVTPWSARVLSELELRVDDLPLGPVDDYRGWPREAFRWERGQLSRTLAPSWWWTSLRHSTNIRGPVGRGYTRVAHAWRMLRQGSRHVRTGP